MTHTNGRLPRLVRAVGTLLAVAFGLLGISLVALAMLARTDDGGVTRIAGHPVMTVLSDSMTPTFKAGDILVEESVDGRADELAVGTVISFYANNVLVTHRIVRVKELSDGGVIYRTQGDANNMIDATPVEPDQVVGRYSWHVPSLGYVLANVRTPMGMSLLLLVPALIFLVPLFAKWWRAAGDEPGVDKEEKEPELARAG